MLLFFFVGKDNKNFRYICIISKKIDEMLKKAVKELLFSKTLSIFADKIY